MFSIFFKVLYTPFWPFSVENIFVTRIPSTWLCEHSYTNIIGASKVVTIASWMVYGYTQVTMLNMGHMNKENNSDIRKNSRIFFSSSKHFTCPSLFIILSRSNYIIWTQKHGLNYIIWNMFICKQQLELSSHSDTYNFFPNKPPKHSKPKPPNIVSFSKWNASDYIIQTWVKWKSKGRARSK